MALQGQLKVGAHTYGVVECSYEFFQSIDDTGKPTSRPRGGTIKFVIPATSDDDLFFYNWMFNKTQVYDGTFKFCVYTTRNQQSYKTVRFTNAYCVNLQDYFNDSDSKLMYTTVTISAEIISIGRGGGALLNNDWK